MVSPKQILIQERQDLIHAAQAVFDTCANEKRGLSAEELAGDDVIQKRVEAINGEIVVLERQERERAPVADSHEWDGWDGTTKETPTFTPTPRAGGRTFRSLFPDVALNCGPFKGNDDFWKSFLQRGEIADARMLEFQAVQSTIVDSEGGVSMPTTVMAGVLDAALETSIVLSRADVIPMTTEKHRVWAFDNSSVSGGSLFSNVTAQWIAEGATATAATLETKKITLNARKLMLLAQESREVVQSGTGFASALETAIGQAVGWYADDAYLHGDGIGKPQGALTSANPARISVSRAGGNAIAAADVLGMAERMHPALFNEAVWITSNPTLTELAGLHVAGTNSDNFLFAPSQGAGLPNTLLGRPILLSEKSANLGTEADIALVAFSGYAVGMRRGIEIDTSQEVGFTSDTIYIRGILRTDGQSKWLSTFQPKDSNSATLSWCVVLAA